MSYPLPSGLIAFKNAMENNDPALLVVKLEMDNLVEPVRVVSNDENIAWEDPDTSTIEDWVAFPFEIDDIGEPGRGELPQVVLRVSNVTRAVQGYIDEVDGGVDATVTLHVINGGDLSVTDTFITLVFRASSTTCDENWVTFRLTSLDLWRELAPRNHFNKNHCDYLFKGVFCKYAGVETTCDGTLARCRELNNVANFGGFPSIGFDGVRY